MPQFSFEVFRNTDESDAEHQRPGVNSGIWRVCVCHRAGPAGCSRKVRRRHERPHAARADRLGCRGRSNAGGVAERQADFAGRQLVWNGPARRHLPIEARASKSPDKITQPLSWSVAGAGRGSGAYLVSQIDGRAAYGGTPSDQTVIAAIRDLNSARAQCDDDAVHSDGRAGRQHAAQSVWRRQSAGVSVARAHHLSPGSRTSRHR